MAEATAIRPNGKPYRRRAPVQVIEFTDRFEDTGVVVVGTHDVKRAREAADSLLTEYGFQATDPQQVWWREVPWDDSGIADRSWVDDAVRGVPCVVWLP